MTHLEEYDESWPRQFTAIAAAARARRGLRSVPVWETTR
jgi:hypothetical protein